MEESQDFRKPGNSKPVEETKGSIKEGPNSSEETSLHSVVKPLVEQVSEAAEDSVQNVAESPYVAEMAKQVEKMVHFPNTKASKSSTAEKTAGDSAQPADANSDQIPGTADNQPLVGESTRMQASWMNCCGLLDVL